MTDYHNTECPDCQGHGVIRHRLVLERPCPLCAGTGKVIDSKHPVELTPSEAEIKVTPPKTTAELLANLTPLGRKTSTALLTTRHQTQADTAALLGEGYRPVAGAPLREDTTHARGEFAAGGNHAKKNFTGRQRAR